MKLSFSLILPIFAACLSSAQGNGVTVRGEIVGDADFVALGATNPVSYEGRIGNPGNEHEWNIHENLPTYQTLVQENSFTFGSGTPENFIMTYDAPSQVMTLTMKAGTITTTLDLEEQGPYKDMFIRTRAVKPGSSIELTNLVLNGADVPDTSSACTGTSNCGSDIGANYLWLQDFTESFTLEGTVTMTWDAANAPARSQLAFQVKMGDAPSAHILGDPHVRGWKNAKRESFHGECDMVLLRSDSFDDGEGLKVHVRTTMHSSDSFSYVEAAAVEIGQHHFEIDHDGNIALDGSKVTDDMLPLAFGKQGHYAITGPFLQQGKRKTVYLYRLELTNEHGHLLSFIEFKTHVHFMAVSVHGHPSHMTGSVGLLGEYGTGARHDRNGGISPSMEHHGHEWKVQGHESQLFAPRGSDITPDGKCKMPNYDQSRRRLRQNRHLLEEASEVCDKLYPNDADLCVQDVLLSGDIETVYAWSE